MAILNSKQLWAERKALADKQAQAMEAENADDARIIEGQIRQLDITIDHVIEQENELRDTPKPKAEPQSFAARILGARDEFSPLDVGFKNTASVTHVSSPTEIELELPAKLPSILNNFASTILETPAAGSVSYKQRDTQTGNPATWGGVADGVSASKAQVLYKWKDAVANKETVAGYVPVSKDSLADYDELMDIIENDLLIDLNEITNAKYLTGNSQTGIIGALNTVGIQSFTTHMASKYYDAIRMMRTLVMQNSRRIPTHVCVNPSIKEAIDLYKTSTGLYQTLGDNILWGMQVVEDTNCAGILVYDSFAARRRAIHGGTTVEIGYYNDQFIKNELSILAEHTKAFQMRYPDAFCYALKTDLDQTS